MTAEPYTPRGEDVDFAVRKEVWNKYILQDNTILKFKVILVKATRTRNYDPLTGDPIYFFGSTNAMTTYAPKELKGMPTGPRPTPQQLQESIVGEVDVNKTIVEEWNEYALDDGTIVKMKPVMVKVIKTKKHEESGDPIYIVNSQNVLKVEVPAALKLRLGKSENRKGPPYA